MALYRFSYVVASHLDLPHRHGFRLRVEPGLAAHGEAVDGLQERLGAGFDDIGTDGLAALRSAFVLDFDPHFALGVFAAGDVADLAIAPLDLHAGATFGRLE